MSKQKLRSTRAIVMVGAALLLSGGITVSTGAQQNRPAQTAGVDNTKMGAYRALAQLTFDEFQKGNSAKAAELARILERTWDQGEEGAADKNLQKRSPEAFDHIDHAMDDFIKPILRSAQKPPQASSVQAAYNQFLDKLKEGDSTPLAGGAAAPAAPAAGQTATSATHLSAAVLNTFTGKFQAPPPPDAPAGASGRQINIVANPDGLVLTMADAPSDGHPLLPVSASGEFYSQEQPDIHITFTKNAQGEVTGFTVTNFPPLQQATKCAGSC